MASRARRRTSSFSVGDEAFEHHPGGIVTMKPGVPIQVDGVLVDLLSAQPHHGLFTPAPP
jgi:hypothetical protein